MRRSVRHVARCIRQKQFTAAMIPLVEQTQVPWMAAASAAAGAVSIAAVHAQHEEAGTPLQGVFNYETDPQKIKNLLHILRDVVGSNNFSTDDEDTAAAGDAKWSFHTGPAPYAVVTPHSTEEVSAVLAACHAARVPVIATGGGTSLEGHTTAPYRGISLNLREMDAVVDYSRANLDVVVQPGITWEELNTKLKPHGVFFPVDPGPGATIGGMVNTGCSGTNAVRYGAMKRHVVNLTVVLADGRVMTTAARTKKTSAGYDLTNTIVGSEGTLGIVTQATLRVTPLPEAQAVAVCAFPSIAAACTAVQELCASGVGLHCVELLDEWMVRAVNNASGFNYKEVPTLFFKFSGTRAELQAQAAATRAAASAAGGAAFRWEDSEAGMAKLWEARKVALWSAPVLQETHDPVTKQPRAEGGAGGGDVDVWITDVCVPLSALAETISAIKARSDASPLHAPIVGHIGDGNVHSFILMRRGSAADRAEGEALSHDMAVMAIDAHGTCTGEHGVGVGKRAYLRRELGPAALQAMAGIKVALDPRGILNPGKVLPDEFLAAAAKRK